MEESLYQIMYVSSARPELTEDALHEILSAAQTNNAKRGISGILLHSDGNLLQLIEGSESQVNLLFDKISQDTRHDKLLVLYRQQVKTRDFPDFKMGFRRVKRQVLQDRFPAFTDIVEKRQLNQASLKGLSKHVSVFLRTFARTTRIES